MSNHFKSVTSMSSASQHITEAMDKAFSSIMFSRKQESAALGNLLRSSTGMAMAPGMGISLSAIRNPRLELAENRAVNEEKLGKYYQRYLKNRDTAKRIRAFHAQPRDSMVWVIDCYVNPGRLTASGPFKSEDELQEFLISSAREKKSSRIFVVDGINSWSAAVIGLECRVPVEFFIDSADEQYVQLKANDDMETGCAFTIDNGRVVDARPDGEQRRISFEALGNSEIQLQRSHIFFGNLPHYELKTAVVLCNESEKDPLGPALVKKLTSDAAKSERLCYDIFWLLWDVYHELNNWPLIIDYVKWQLHFESVNAEHPELDLTKALHKDASMYMELQEMLRVQLAVLDGFIRNVNPEGKFPKGSAMFHIKDLKNRIIRQKEVLEILSKQTSNLIGQVYNFMAIQESTYIGKLTWITLIYVPISYTASLFSMNVTVLDPRPEVWSYVAVAVCLLIITLGAAVGVTSAFQHRRKLLKIFRDTRDTVWAPTDPKFEGVVIDEDPKPDADKPRTQSVSFTVRSETDASPKKNLTQFEKHRQDLRQELRGPAKLNALETSIQMHQIHASKQVTHRANTTSNWVKVIDLELSVRQKKIFEDSRGPAKDDIEISLEEILPEEVRQWNIERASLNTPNGPQRHETCITKTTYPHNKLGITFGDGKQESPLFEEDVTASMIEVTSSSLTPWASSKVSGNGLILHTDEENAIPGIPIITINSPPVEEADNVAANTDREAEKVSITVMPDESYYNEGNNARNEQAEEAIVTESSKTTIQNGSYHPNSEGPFSTSSMQSNEVKTETHKFSKVTTVPTFPPPIRFLKLRLIGSQIGKESATDVYLIPYHEADTWDKLQNALMALSEGLPRHIKSRIENGVYNAMVDGAIVPRQFWEPTIYHMSYEAMDGRQPIQNSIITIRLESGKTVTASITSSDSESPTQQAIQHTKPSKPRRFLQRSYSIPEIKLHKKSASSKEPIEPSTFSRPQSIVKSQKPGMPGQAPANSQISATRPLPRPDFSVLRNINEDTDDEADEFIPKPRIDRAPTLQETMITAGISASRMPTRRDTNASISTTGSPPMASSSRFLTATFRRRGTSSFRASNTRG